jgi:hypothetical protein
MRRQESANTFHHKTIGIVKIREVIMKYLLKSFLILSAIFVSLAGYSMYCYKHASKFEQCVADFKVKNGIDFWKQDKGAEYICSDHSAEIKKTALMLEAREAKTSAVVKLYKDHGIDLPRSLIE